MLPVQMFQLYPQCLEDERKMMKRGALRRDSKSFPHIGNPFVYDFLGGGGGAVFSNFCSWVQNCLNPRFQYFVGEGVFQLLFLSSKLSKSQIIFLAGVGEGWS